LRYTWTSTATGKISGNSQNNVPKALTEIVETLTNAGDSTGSVTYTIVPANTTGCAGEAVVVKINVSASAGITTFSPDKTTGCSPLKIAFKNTTKGSINTYHWDFGDGQTLTTTDNNTVNHTYFSSVAKTVTAKLVTETDCGSYTSEYVIRITPNTVQPELVVNGDEYEGCAPHTVKFFNNSKGAVFYKYDFGDGTIIEGNQSPETISHTFTQGGTYVVKLTASNGCSDTTTTETIKVYPQAVTNFSADVTSACDSVTVKFANLSKNALAYLWDFGDGTTSKDPNPTHPFTDAKPSYTVSLISYSSFGCGDTLQKIDYIKVGATPHPAFVVSPGLTIQYPNYRFTFKNDTPGDMQSYLWEFGDGQTSTSVDAEHSYPDTGAYEVKLTAINKTGCSNTITQTVRILGVPGNLFIPNAFMPNSLVDEIRIFQAKGSGMAEWHLRVFNKWGQLIWQTTQLDDKGRPVEGWDGMMFGEKAPQGVYFWEAGAKFINGTEWAGMQYSVGSDPKKAGTFNLIR
jgi:PKD repeat protein